MKKPNEINIYRIMAVLNLTIGEGGTIGTELNWAQETRVHSSGDIEVWIWLTKVGCGVIDSFFGQMTMLKKLIVTILLPSQSFILLFQF